MRKVKIGFCDIDMTLVDNESSKYNMRLVAELAQYDEVILITGRSPNDLWQHNLQQGRLPQDYQNQFIPVLLENLKVRRGVNVTSVSLPFDHYLATVDPVRKWQAGDSYQEFYGAFEHAVLEEAHRYSIIQESLTRLFLAKAPHKYPDGLGGEDTLFMAMNTWLAVNGDTEKKGQFRFQLEALKARHPGDTLECHFWDDKPENLRSATEVFGTEGITLTTELVDIKRDIAEEELGLKSAVTPDLKTLCELILDTTTERKTRIKHLILLHDRLVAKDYTLHFWGGEKVKRGAETVRRPRNIQKIIDWIRSETHSEPIHIGLVIKNTFKFAVDAVENPQGYCCGLFNPRDATTQDIYATMASAYHEASLKKAVKTEPEYLPLDML